jgi:hypothetical protein
MGLDMLIIDESNYNYLVRQETTKYNVSLYYGLPRRTRKGFIGINHKSAKFEFIDKDEAIMKFANWKEEFISKYYRKELVDLYITFMPITYYYVTCPKCGQDAEILDFMGLIEFGEGTENCSYHNIACRHCAENKEPGEWFYNNVGKCYVDVMKDDEELNIRLQQKVNNIKYEDWIKNVESSSN